MHALRAIRALLMLPASLSLSPALLVLDVRSEPARSTNESWEIVILVLSCIEMEYKYSNTKTNTGYPSPNMQRHGAHLQYIFAIVIKGGLNQPNGEH